MILAKRKSEIINQVFLGKHKGIKLHKAIDDFILSRAKKTGAAMCRQHLTLFKALPNTDLDKVQLSAAQEIVDERLETRAIATCKQTVIYFNAMVNHFAENDYRVCKKLKRINIVTNRIRWMTDQEEADLDYQLQPTTATKAAPSEARTEQRQVNYDIYIALRHTGARLNEVAQLQWNHVDFKTNSITILRSKGSEDSTILMSNKLRTMLQRRHAEKTNSHVFPTKHETYDNTAWFTRAVKRANLSDANGAVSIHTLRHTAAVKWLAGGMSLLELKEQLGHKNIQSTMVYAKLIPVWLRSVAWTS